MDIEEFKTIRATLIETLKEQRAELVEKLRVLDQELSELGEKRRGRKPGVTEAPGRPKRKRRGRPPKTAPAARN